MNVLPKLIRTVVVDDSAFVRKAVREMLAGNSFIEVVGQARDGHDALELVAELMPDVVTCDLSMPRVDGVEFVRQQMARRPVPILILTAAPQDGEKVLEALSAGAVDLVLKPNALATDDLLKIRDQLVAKIRSAAGAVVGSLARDGDGKPDRPVALVTGPLARSASAKAVDVVVLGISTGGPQALRYLLPRFPADFPVPLAIVLHMPLGYTALFAEKLDEISQLEVREAQEGDVLRPGLALLAPAGRHLSFRRVAEGRVVAHLSVQPVDKIHRPAADVLFRSAADVFGRRVLGVVMTGMGDDGREGAAWIKAQGGTILTEAEASCVIYGMPRSVVEAGLSDAAIPLPEMAQAIIQYL